MQTTNLNINPSTGSDDKSKKTEKVKKISGKAAQFAGAVGLGVAGTMVANAMNKNGEDLVEEVAANPGVATAENASEDVHAESVTDFDPNDIMIEDNEIVDDDVIVETVDISHETNPGEMAVVEPQPITGEDIVTTNAEVLITEVDPTDVSDECMYGGPDGWDDFDPDDILLTDNDDITDDIDIADDILA